MTRHSDWFSVDIGKRAARVRSRPLWHILKELPANGLDADATIIELICARTDGSRRDGAKLFAITVRCRDNGKGCPDPEILRRVGSSTSDLHAELRGRFGHGLIDFLSACQEAEIRSLGHRLVFASAGCRITAIRDRVAGMTVTAVLRHGGEGFEDLDRYFDSVIVPSGVTFVFNGREIMRREPVRVVSGVKLQTVLYDPRTERISRPLRATNVEILPQHGDAPMIYELGIPVDAAPWRLPYDLNVLQKTPLDTDRNVLPAKYSAQVIAQLVGPMSSEYADYMAEHDEAPSEIRDDRQNAALLTPEVQRALVKTVTGVEPERIVRRNPLDRDDTSESQELENHGYAPINRGSLPAGVSELLRVAPTVAEVHDRECKPHFDADPEFPAETERQRRCMDAFAEIATALLDRPVRCDRIQGGSTAAWRAGVISLNIEASFLWTDPLGEVALGTILHECAHATVSGHSIAFTNEVARLGGRLAAWVGADPARWSKMRSRLYSSSGRATGLAGSGKSSPHTKSLMLPSA